MDLLERLIEDHFFGIHTFNINDKVVSRDLLDSVSEISFLEEELDLSSLPTFTVLDIGSGYGRMAYRMTSTFNNIREYLCTDAIPVSSFICEHYLNFRNINKTASILPLNEIEVLANKKVDLDINIHSFSECSIPAITWWCNHLAEYGIRYLMIVPNAGVHGGERLATTPGNEDFQKIIEEAGYQLVTKRPKYKDPAVQRNGIFPTYYYLFSLSQ